MKASGLSFGVKINEEKEHHPIYYVGEIYDAKYFLNSLQLRNLKILINFHARFRY